MLFRSFSRPCTFNRTSIRSCRTMSIVSPTPSRAFRRQRTLSSSSMSLINEPIDADDSIVLSDLVRTGEASRLRRRGAMRLDRNSMQPVRRPGIFFEDSDSDDENRPYSFAYGEILDRRHRSFTSHQHQYPSYSSLVAEPDVNDDSPPYILVCGAKVVDSVPQQKPCAPFEPSIFPVMPGEQASGSRSPSPPPSTNGCGTVIHFHGACPQAQATTKTFTARSRTTDIVVPLEAEYFSNQVAKTFETSPCGCVQEGIGCAVCGNPLGTRWRFCPRMAESRKPPSQRRRGLPAELDPDLDLELYTFFADAVSGHPDPSYEPPAGPQPPSEPTSPLSSPRFAPASPPRRTTWLPDDSDSDSENEIEFAQIVTEAREVRIDFQGPQSWNRPSLVVNVPPPMLNRQMTSSPDSILDDEDSNLMTLDADGNERPYASLMDALRRESTPAVVDSPLARLPRQVQPEPQPMSFYQQQVLGAWERERDRQVQTQEPEAHFPSPMPWYTTHDTPRTVTFRDSVEALPTAWGPSTIGQD